MLYVMLVGAYPFERPEDKHDAQKLQKMIQVSVGPGWADRDTVPVCCTSRRGRFLLLCLYGDGRVNYTRHAIMSVATVIDAATWVCCLSRTHMCCLHATHFPQRILQVDYAVPAHIKLSEDCRALLKSILVPGECIHVASPRQDAFCGGCAPAAQERVGKQRTQLTVCLLIAAPTYCVDVVAVRCGCAQGSQRIRHVPLLACDRSLTS
jgi:hypothetical protein